MAALSRCQMILADFTKFILKQFSPGHIHRSGEIYLRHLGEAPFIVLVHYCIAKNVARSSDLIHRRLSGAVLNEAESRPPFGLVSTFLASNATIYPPRLSLAESSSLSDSLSTTASPTLLEACITSFNNMSFVMITFKASSFIAFPKVS